MISLLLHKKKKDRFIHFCCKLLDLIQIFRFICFFSSNSFCHKVTKTQGKIKPLILSVFMAAWAEKPSPIFGYCAEISEEAIFILFLIAQKNNIRA